MLIPRSTCSVAKSSPWHRCWPIPNKRYLQVPLPCFDQILESSAPMSITFLLVIIIFCRRVSLEIAVFLSKNFVLSFGSFKKRCTNVYSIIEHSLNLEMWITNPITSTFIILNMVVENFIYKISNRYPYHYLLIILMARGFVIYFLDFVGSFKTIFHNKSSVNLRNGSFHIRFSNN